MPSAARCCSLVLLAVMATVTTALQVTPDSPCASLCLDSSSRPSNSSSVAKIRDAEIICSNRDYASEQGQKFQRCMNCLQNSTYSQGSQNDQAWFIYNLQYAYAHCVFGYPNGNGIGPYPCMTSEACGPLNVTVRRNLANNTGTDPFNYCSYRGGSSFGGTFSKCLDCMKADREHGYVANFFVALQAGCEQRPGPEGHLSLNGTLFDSRTISIVDPNKPSPSRKTGLSTGALVAVVIISVLLGLLLLGGGIFLYIRRRRRRLESDPHDGKSALEYAAARQQQQNGRHGPSSMDFHCAENVSPFTPGSRDGGSVQAQQQQQQQHYHPQVRPTATAIYPDEKRNGTLEKKAYNDALRSHPPVAGTGGAHHDHAVAVAAVAVTVLARQLRDAVVGHLGDAVSGPGANLGVSVHHHHHLWHGTRGLVADQAAVVGRAAAAGSWWRADPVQGEQDGRDRPGGGEAAADDFSAAAEALDVGWKAGIGQTLGGGKGEGGGMVSYLYISTNGALAIVAV
ncbi:hypothetical protein BBAD15_g8831 [Beauveria bassiana D1-5]|uniref:LPXTG-domain-containing protein n=1 Tax=Beauveria bassiana D1-5 TaxID=1245745 RepID=A0A0A2VHW5_BEABA|nr:hypothetical protein BBAD15_g8831 [Beauveria bassiana D1-5]